MRLLALSLLIPGFLTAQTPPTVGVIDYYGLNKINRDKIARELGFREGDPFPRSKADIEEKLDGLSGIVESHLEAVCCDQGKMVIYVGLEERGAPHFDVRETPEGEVTLPEDIVALYRRFSDAVDAASRRGSTAEDLTRGYSLMADSDARSLQQQFIPLAKDRAGALRDVLRNSADDEQRAMAAYILGYGAEKQDVVEDLQFALRDADPGVRSNAAHGLMAIAVYNHLHPDDSARLEATWFIEMLNSLSWTDRNLAMKALQILTDDRSERVLDQVRDRAILSLAEMSRWKTLQHALPAFILTGRVAGLSDQQIQDSWNKGDRETVIAAALKKPRRR